MELASDLLASVLRQTRQPQAALAWLASAWPEIAGRTLSAHARPVHCAEVRLDLAVDGQPWQAEIERLAPALRERINGAWGAPLVREVKCISARQGSAAGEHDNNRNPFIRRRSF